MHTRTGFFVLLVLLASCRPEDAGIVLNVDTADTADRSAINRLVVTVDGTSQEWNLTRSLPGSLGIKTSAGMRPVNVDGFTSAGLRCRWSGTVDARKRSTIVQDVHLIRVTLDGGVVEGGLLDAAATDGSRSDRSADVASDLVRDGADVREPAEGGRGDGIPSLDGGLAQDGFGKDGGALDGPSDVGLAPSDSAGLPSATVAGSFAVRSPFDIAATAAAPGRVHDAINLMHVFVEDPGAAILNYADQAGVPAASTLRAALPSVLLNRLTGWMNTYIKSAGSQGVVPYDRLVWLDDTVRALLLSWTLESRLALPIGAPGTHTPRTLIFTDPTGTPLPYPVDPALLTPATNVTALVSWPGGATSPATATISDHAFSLPFGRYALPALNAILLARYGTPSVAAYLSDAVGCAGLGESVGSQCVSLVCVGHESDLTSLCEGGLAEGARQIEAEIQAIDFQAIRLQRGTATAVGAEVTEPQKLAALQNGTWTVTVDFGNGPQPASATFSATLEAGTMAPAP